MFVRLAALLAGVLLAVAFGAMATWPPIAEVVAGQSPEYPAIRPVDFRFSADRVHAGAVEVLGARPQAVVQQVDPATRTVVARWSGPVHALDVELTIRVEPNGNAGSVVFCRSRLLKGRADFGQNARVIEAFQLALAENLALARAD